MYRFQCLLCGFLCGHICALTWIRPPFSADVLGGSVDEPLELGGDGEEGPRELPHPLTADHQEDQRGERAKVKVYGQRGCIVRCIVCVLMSFYLCVCVFRLRSSVSMSWWLPSPSCSPPHCFRYKSSRCYKNLQQFDTSFYISGSFTCVEPSPSKGHSVPKIKPLQSVNVGQASSKKRMSLEIWLIDW